MRRLLALLLFAAVLGCPSAATTAVGPVHQQIWRGSLPSGFSFQATPCGTRVGPSPGYYYGHDPHATVGTGSMTVPNWDAVTHLTRAFSSLASVGQFRVSITTYFGEPLSLEVAVPGAGVSGTGSVPGAYLSAWATTDLVDQVDLDWADGSRGTVAEFAAAHPDAAAEPASITLATGCAQDDSLAGSYSIDAADLEVNGTSTRVDFEESRYPVFHRFSLQNNWLSTTYGETTTLRAELRQDNAVVPGTPVQLWARHPGEKTSHLVSTATTDDRGTAAVVVRSDRRTFYTWRYAVTDDFPSTVSETTLELGVQAQVRMRIARQRVRLGRPQIAVVHVDPARGQRVRLRQVVGRGRWGRVFATGVIGPHGSARLRFTVPRPGRWRVVAVVGSTPGVQGWHSRTARIRVPLSR